MRLYVTLLFASCIWWGLSFDTYQNSLKLRNISLATKMEKDLVDARAYQEKTFFFLDANAKIPFGILDTLYVAGSEDALHLDIKASITTFGQRKNLVGSLSFQSDESHKIQRLIGTLSVLNAHSHVLDTTIRLHVKFKPDALLIQTFWNQENYSLEWPLKQNFHLRNPIFPFVKVYRRLTQPEIFIPERLPLRSPIDQSMHILHIQKISGTPIIDKIKSTGYALKLDNSKTPFCTIFLSTEGEVMGLHLPNGLRMIQNNTLTMDNPVALDVTPWIQKGFASYLATTGLDATFKIPGNTPKRMQ